MTVLTEITMTDKVVIEQIIFTMITKTLQNFEQHIQASE